MSTADKRVVVTERDPILRSYLCRFLKRQGYEACGIEHGDKIPQALDDTDAWRLVLDNTDQQSSDCLGWLSQHHPDLPVVMTSINDESLNRPTPYSVEQLKKPFDADELLQLLNN